MDYPDPSSAALRCRPSADKPDGLLDELREAHVALGIAEHHIRLWRANSQGDMQFRPRLSFVAYEALYEAGGAIDRIAELLKFEANGTRATQQGHSA